jgi:DNA-binding transcriptional regulator YdaS (Cro superfamily)
MLLKDYIKKHGLSLEKVAAMAGISKSLLAKISMGNRNCTGRTAIKIERATCGEISRGEMMWPDAYTDELIGGAEQMRFTPKIEEQSATNTP